MNRFIGEWKNKEGNKLIIKKRDAETVSVTFISGKTNKPIERPFLNDEPTIDMEAKLDYYQTSIEVELWKKGKGFHLCLLHDNYSGNQIELSPSISMYSEDIESRKYVNLFDPLHRYTRIKEGRKR